MAAPHTLECFLVVELQALVGYLREAERGPYVDEEFPYTHGRYRCWLSLGVTHWLVPNASLAGHVSGIAAGLLTIYLPQACESSCLWVLSTFNAFFYVGTRLLPVRTFCCPVHRYSSSTRESRFTPSVVLLLRFLDRSR